jgi:ABC-2 type transport system permease protein
MTDFIDAQRDERDELFNQPDSVFQEHLNSLFPQILNSPVAQDSTKMNLAMNRSGAALTNELMKKSFHTIEESNSAKNDLIRSSYWFNPVTFFQNQLNAFSGTHYRDYQNYRQEIQTMIDKQVKEMVLDTWNEVKVDKEKYLKYNENLKP